MPSMQSILTIAVIALVVVFAYDRWLRAALA